MFAKKAHTVIVILAAAAALFLTSCSGTQHPDGAAEKGEYMRITAEQAKELMDTETDYIILDVRTDTEYDEGHIENAVLSPDYELSDRAKGEITDKNKLILVYCRTGRRSKLAAEQLIELGYTNVKDFGGITDWQYETVK